MSMHLILVAPGLLARPPQALAAARSLATLAHLAGRPRVHPRGLRAALIDALGAPADTPVAPLAALGAGVAPADDYVAVADPVLLAADRDDLVLVQRIDDLGADESNQLVALLNRHFDGDDLTFAPARPDAWFVRCVRAPGIETTPFDVARGKGVFPYQPGGPAGGTWRRWQNEIGMLLHEHPVNVARQAAGRLPVTGIWFWGGGRLADVAPLPATNVTAVSGSLGDLARGIAHYAGGTAHRAEPDDTAQSVIERATPRAPNGTAAPTVAVVVLAPRAEETDGGALESAWLAPALALMSSRRVETLSLLADGNGTAAQWTVTRPTLWRRLVAGTRRGRFAVPAPVES